MTGSESISLGPTGPFPGSPLTHALERRWLHYALLSLDGRLGLVANLSWLGPDAGDTPARPQRMGIVLLYEPDLGWHASQFNCAQPDEPWSAFRLPHTPGVGQRMRLAAHAGTPFVELELMRTSRPCSSQCTPFARGQHLRWQSESGVRARGSWGIRDALFPAVAALGYHERVRGIWGWPELGGWVFGFVNDPSGDGSAAPPVAVVFTLIQPPVPESAATGSVMLWRHGRLIRHFPRRSLQVVASGRLERDRVSQVPDLSNVLGVPPMEPVPAGLSIDARLGHDRLSLEFECRTAARIVIPNETGLRPFSVHEVIGSCRVRGTISSRRVAFEAAAIVEFAGGARSD